MFERTKVQYNRPYSKISKSTGAKVAVIFAYIRFSVIASFVVVNTLFDCWNNMKRTNTKTEVRKKKLPLLPLLIC
jgi:hypothetical protein